MMMPGMMDGMKPMMPMEMCPATQPAEGSACKGHPMCTFAALECHCVKDTWTCGTNEMMPDADAGATP